MQSSWGSGCVGDTSPRRAVGLVRDVEGKTVTIDLGSLTIEFDDLLPEAQKVLDTVKWAGS